MQSSLPNLDTSTIQLRDSGRGAPFLTAEWRYLVMINWRVDPDLLAPHVPRGTTIDRWNDSTYVSLVGFLFLDTRVRGIPIPLHRDFEEVNLRFYVARHMPDETRRGVTFLKELVPRRAIAALARWRYNEPYETRRMRHSITFDAQAGGREPNAIEYGWRQRSAARWGSMRVATAGPPELPAPGSQAEFIAEHYWGYTRQRDGSTIEYRVTHPPWRVWPVDAVSINADLEELYGPGFGGALGAPPTSAFLAEGSAVGVYAPVRLSSGPVSR